MVPFSCRQRPYLRVLAASGHLTAPLLGVRQVLDQQQELLEALLEHLVAGIGVLAQQVGFKVLRQMGS